MFPNSLLVWVGRAQEALIYQCMLVMRGNIIVLPEGVAHKHLYMQCQSHLLQVTGQQVFPDVSQSGQYEETPFTCIDS